MTVMSTIASARCEVTFSDGRTYVIELEPMEGLPIIGQLSVDVEAVDDLPASWEAGYMVRRPGLKTADIALRGKVARESSSKATVTPGD